MGPATLRTAILLLGFMYSAVQCQHSQIDSQIATIIKELEEQKQFTIQMKEEIIFLRTELSKSKEDISSLNYKSVSLYNKGAESLDTLSRTLEDLVWSTRNRFQDVNMDISYIKNTIVNYTEAGGREQEEKLKEQEERSRKERSEQEGIIIKKVDEQERRMRKEMKEQEEKIFASNSYLIKDINLLKREIQSKKYALSSTVQETNSLLNKLSNETRELRSLTDGATASLAGLEQGLELERGLEQELTELRLQVATDTAITRLTGGGWVTIQRRGDYGNKPGYFRRTMQEYIKGFGDPAREFWIGLDTISKLSEGGTKLIIELETWQGDIIEGEYSVFRVGKFPEFILTVEGYSGSIGDCLRIENGMGFSSWDVDQDNWSGSCSSTRGGGGWWFNACGLANLNGERLGQGQLSYSGIIWFLHDQSIKSFKSSRMMLKLK